MPFPDGTGLDGDPFTQQHQANAAAMASIGAGVPTPGHLGVGPPGLQGEGLDAEAAAGLPSYLSAPSQFVPSPEHAMENGVREMALADPATAATAFAPPSLNLSTAATLLPPSVAAHDAIIYQPDALLLSGSGDDGLIWKVACKTGTLALSPGPGQVDVDRPLNLTSEMFAGIKHAFDDRAFPHVTVPETHANGVLDNTGYVRQVEVLGRDDLLADQRFSSMGPGVRADIANDPDGTEYLVTGLDFTEPSVREKVLNGSVADTSVGVKFGYRNKRTGTTYDYALEHLALTNVPWVDGLVPFGGAALSQQPFDAEAVAPFDGVFVRPEDIDLSAAAPKKVADAVRDQNMLNLGMEVSFRGDSWEDIDVDMGKAHAVLSGLGSGDRLELPLGVCVQKIDDAGNDLFLITRGYGSTPSVYRDEPSTIQAATSAMLERKGEELLERAKYAQSIHASQGATPPKAADLLSSNEDVTLSGSTPGSSENEETSTMTVEELLAQQQAQNEANAAELERLKGELALAQGTIGAQGATIHQDAVAKKVADLNGKVPPSLLLAARQIWLGDKSGTDATGGFNLSVTTGPAPVEGGEPTTAELKSPTEIVDFLLSAMPTGETRGATEVAFALTNVAELHASAQQASNEPSPEEKVDAWEREAHPERFENNGTGERING